MNRSPLIQLLLLIPLLLSPVVKAAPAAELWPFWNAYNPDSRLTLNHGEWNDFLHSHVQEDTKTGFYLLNYQAVNDNQRNKLNNYLQTLAAQDPRQLNRNQQFAYWVNLYNALTVQLILDNYPVDSIRSLGGLFSFGPWDKKIITVAGKELTLNDIEHRILRPIWKDPRIHYAVNCASMGCPDLLPQAWTADNYQQLLEQAARRFINQAKGVAVTDDGLTLSKIYSWYGVDFGDRGALLKHLQRYAAPTLAARLRALPDNYKTGFQYDWSLNQAAEKSSQ